MSKANWGNRTMWTGDNLDILRGMNSESVDLVYLDPPFNSNRTYSAPIGSQAAGAAFKDTWTLDDVDVAWHGEAAVNSLIADSTAFWWNEHPTSLRCGRARSSFRKSSSTRSSTIRCPLDINTITALKRSSLGLDLYLWLVGA